MRATRLNVAYHEAGHAVAAIAEGLAVNEVSICGRDDHPGWVSHASPYGYRYTTRRELEAILRSALIVSFAGIEAERIADPDADEESATHDFRRAWETSLELPIRSCNRGGDAGHMRYLRRKRSESRRLVHREKRAVEMLAAELLRCDVLCADRVREIVERGLSDQGRRDLGLAVDCRGQGPAATSDGR